MASTNAGNVFDEVRDIAEAVGSVAERKKRIEQPIRQSSLDPAVTERREGSLAQLPPDRPRAVSGEAGAVFQHAEDVLNSEA